MKKVYKLYLLLPALILLLAVCFVALLGGNNSVYADTSYRSEYNRYTYYFENYDVVYDVETNREVHVTETIAVHYTGWDSTGIIKDIPVNMGERIKNVEVKELVNGALTSVAYSVYFESEESYDFLCLDIGDYTNKTNKTCTYVLTYDYCMSKTAEEGDNAIFLNAIGLGNSDMSSDIGNVSVTVIVPNGYKNAVCMVGTGVSENSDEQTPFLQVPQDNGKTALVLKNFSLSPREGVTFYMYFEDGILSTNFDVTPYLFILVGLVLIAVIIILKLFIFNKNKLMPVVNYEAPNKMDPLLMGKLIDNKVNNEDVTSLLYYWADKGYIKINLDDKKDPAIIRVMQSLPESSPEYEQIMYHDLFKRGDVVKPSQLKNSFYKTVERVTANVNKRTTGLYDHKSLVVSIIFALLGGLFAGAIPLLVGMLTVSSELFFVLGFIAIIPVIVIYFLCQAAMYNRLKFKKNTFILCCCGLGIIAIFMCVFYVAMVPDAIMSLVPKIIIYFISCAIGILSVLLINRTARYTEQLNDIIGFKNFIALAERDRLEMMIEEDPQLFYHILPYAQVLGVTDTWEKKFESLTIQPPQWLTGNMVATYFEFRIFNSIMITSMRNISTNMVSRPSSSGRSGGGFGGFGGGHVGGGHGGGGFRGR